MFLKDWDNRLIRGEPVHDQYYERPELTMLDALYFQSWNDLSTERPIGFGEGPIPHSKIAKYGSDYLGLSGDGLEFFITVIRKVDAGYLTSSEATRSDSNVRDVVSINDAIGVKGLLSRLAGSNEGDRFRKSARPSSARKRNRSNRHDQASGGGN